MRRPSPQSEFVLALHARPFVSFESRQVRLQNEVSFRFINVRFR